MRLDVVELLQVEVPMVEPMAAAHGFSPSRLLVFVHVMGDGADGWGECVALNEPTYSSDWSTGEYVVMRDVFGPALLNDDAGVDAGSVHDRLAAFKWHHPAKSAIEMALLDAELKAAGRSMAAHLGATRRTVEPCVVVGLFDGDALIRNVEHKLEAGYRHFKLKVAPGRDVERLDAVMNRFSEVTWRVDANASYRWDNPRHREALLALDGLRPAAIEQPLPPDHPTWYMDLHARISSPVVLDESITSLSAAVAAVNADLCDGVSVKPAMVGGYLAAKLIHDRCLEEGVSTTVGGMIDGPLSRAANLALAALPGFEGPAEIAPDGRWFDERLSVDPVLLHDGRLEVPDFPGIGAQLEPGALRRLTRRTHVARRGG